MSKLSSGRIPAQKTVPDLNSMSGFPTKFERFERIERFERNERFERIERFERNERFGRFFGKTAQTVQILLKKPLKKH